MKAISRVYKIMEYYNLKPSQFEQQCELSNGYLGKQKNRNADLGEGILIKILENCPKINPEWLLTGTGEMVKSEESSMVVEEQKSDYIIELQQFKIERLEQELMQLKKELQSKSDREKASKAKH